MVAWHDPLAKGPVGWWLIMVVNRARVLRRFGLVDVTYKITSGLDALGLPWIRFAYPDRPPQLFDLLGASRLAETLRARFDAN
jgi:hypothetical protein